MRGDVSHVLMMRETNFLKSLEHDVFLLNILRGANVTNDCVLDHEKRLLILEKRMEMFDMYDKLRKGNVAERKDHHETGNEDREASHGGGGEGIFRSP